MTISNTIIYLLNTIKTSKCELDKIICEKKILSFAQQDQKYFHELINLFENEKNNKDKIELATLLARLQYQDVIPFLLKTLESSDINHQYDAAMSLVALSHSKGYETFVKIFQEPRTIPIGWFFSSLTKINNEMSQKVFQKMNAMSPIKELANKWVSAYRDDFDFEECYEDIPKILFTDSNALQEFIEIYNHETNKHNKLDFARFLARGKSHAGESYLLEALQDEDDMRRYRAAMALVEISNPAGADAVRKIIHDPQRIPVGWIFSSLEEINNDMAKELLDYAEKLYRS